MLAVVTTFFIEEIVFEINPKIYWDVILVGALGSILVIGIIAALFEAQKSGDGLVVDCAMTDGSASLMTMFYGFLSSGIWQEERGDNLLDSGAHFYNVYETKDNKFISIGSIEPQFYSLLLEKLEIEDQDFLDQMNKNLWDDLQIKLIEAFKKKTRDDWCSIMEGTDICFAPVLSMKEAPNHPHNKARETFVDYEGVIQPNVAPRFSRTPSQIQGPPPLNISNVEDILSDWD